MAGQTLRANLIELSGLSSGTFKEHINAIEQDVAITIVQSDDITGVIVADQETEITATVDSGTNTIIGLV